jgi:ankyrin repeat protein
MAPVNEGVSEVEKDIFAKIANNDVNGLKNTLLQQKMKVDIYDENGMTPLQHAAYKGNKEIVQMLLDQVSVNAVCTYKYLPVRMVVDYIV